MQLAATDATGRNATAQLPGWAADAGLGMRARASAIAKALSLNKSTISRYLKKHDDLCGADGLVDVAKFDASYGTNPAVLKTAIAATVKSEQQTELPVDEPREEVSNSDSAAVARERRRQEEIKTRNAEYDLAEREGRIVSREEVLASRAAVGVALRDKLLNVDIALGEKIIAAVHEGAEPLRVVNMIVDSHRTVLTEIIAALEKEVALREAEDTTAAETEPAMEQPSNAG